MLRVITCHGRHQRSSVCTRMEHSRRSTMVSVTPAQYRRAQRASRTHPQARLDPTVDRTDRVLLRRQQFPVRALETSLDRLTVRDCTLMTRYGSLGLVRGVIAPLAIFVARFLSLSSSSHRIALLTPALPLLELPLPPLSDCLRLPLRGSMKSSSLISIASAQVIELGVFGSSIRP